MLQESWSPSISGLLNCNWTHCIDTPNATEGFNLTVRKYQGELVHNETMVEFDDM